MEDVKEKEPVGTNEGSKSKLRAAQKKIPTKQNASAKEDAVEGAEHEPRHNQGLGMRGENAAANFLERRGLSVLDRNWSCLAGEVDIVAEENDTLVFIEVKTRSNCDKGLPEEAVDAKKRQKYEKIAGFYLRDHDVVDKAVRFDVISILVVAPERAFLRHHRDAFAFDE